MPNGLTVRTVYRKATWHLQSRGEIAFENAFFFRRLRFESGPTAEEWITSWLDTVEAEIKQIGNAGEWIEQEVPMLEVEGGLTFWPYLARHKSTRHPIDPINFILWDYGAQSIISDLLRNRVGGWAPTVGIALWALIDDTAHGGETNWKRFDEQLRKRPFLGTSKHVRLFGGPNLFTHGKRAYTLAGVHEEQWQPFRNHVVLDWNRARDDLESDLQIVPGAVASTARVPLTSPGSLQNIQYDGQSAYTQLARPSWLVTV